jgi:hypothetical protein
VFVWRTYGDSGVFSGNFRACHMLDWPPDTGLDAVFLGTVSTHDTYKHNHILFSTPVSSFGFPSPLSLGCIGIL